MKVKIVECLSGAEAAEGLTVVIDVYRAFSTACYVFDNDPKEYLAVSRVEDVAPLLEGGHGYCLGERGGRKLDGFDFGNSPVLIRDVDFSGKRIVHTTSSGTKGLLAAIKPASEVITGSFANAAAIVAYIRQQKPEVVTLAAMGFAGHESAEEDVACAVYLKNELEGLTNDFTAVREHLATVEGAKKFFDGNFVDAPEQDYDLCMDLNRFNFIIRAEPFGQNAVRLEKVNVDNREGAGG